MLCELIIIHAGVSKTSGARCLVSLGIGDGFIVAVHLEGRLCFREDLIECWDLLGQVPRKDGFSLHRVARVSIWDRPLLQVDVE